MMAFVCAIGHRFIEFTWAENVHETAVELKHGGEAMVTSVGVFGQHFIEFPWTENVHEAAVELEHG